MVSLLRKLKTQVANRILLADPVGEVARFQQVAAETTVAATWRSSRPHTGCFCGPVNFSFSKWEEHVPATEHEVLEWKADRQEDMATTVLMAWNPTKAARIKLNYKRHEESSTKVGASVHGHLHGPVKIAEEARKIK